MRRWLTSCAWLACCCGVWACLLAWYPDGMLLGFIAVLGAFCSWCQHTWQALTGDGVPMRVAPVPGPSRRRVILEEVATDDPTVIRRVILEEEDT